MTGTRESTELVLLLLPDLATATTARDDVLTAARSGRFHIDDAAVVEHDQGRVRLHQTHDGGAARGFGHGALLGGLAGLFLGSVIAPALVAGAAGAVISRLHDAGIPDDAMRNIGAALADGQAALFVLADPTSARIISDETFAASTVRTFTIRADDADAVRSVADTLMAEFGH